MGEEYFDDKGRIYFPTIEEGRLLLKNSSGTKIPENTIIFSKGERTSDSISNYEIVNAIKDPRSTRKDRKCKCGKNISVIIKYNESYYYICISCSDIVSA